MSAKGYFKILAFLSGLAVFSLATDVCLAKSSSKRNKPQRAAKKTYHVSAQSAIFSDAVHQRRLYAKKIHKKVQPASTTKVMTALLVMERLPLNKVVTVSPSVKDAQPSRLHLKPGEQYKVSDLLYAILLNSANDAAIVLAESVAGSEEKFVQLMNARARQLGASHTRFANSTGLPNKGVPQYTTAYDMSLIFRQALLHPFFKEAVGRKHKTIYSRAGRKITLKSHNKMLFTQWGKNVHGKTGYTRAAQACFVGYTTQGGRTFILAVFGCSRRWDDIKHLVKKYSFH